MAGSILREDVPSFRSRPGDHTIGGANNTLLVLGRDRHTTADTGHMGPRSGAIYIVAGREGHDVSHQHDRASVYVSANSDPDDYLGISVGESRREVSCVNLRADSVRISARRDVKVVVGRASLTMSEDGSIVIEGDIRLGRRAVERVLKGDSFAAYHATHVHPVTVLPGGAMVAGPTTSPVPASVFSETARTE
jgi:hypothetical protein